MQNQELDPEQQLALLTEIRMIVSIKDEEVTFNDLVINTNILFILVTVLNMEDNRHEYTRFMKLEGTWIISNIVFGNQDVIEIVFKGDFDFFTFFNTTLMGNDLQ
mmetsp:Transcript_3625/g.5464  ORF Transcript_3625/g.5464 Transcript_3625/m.5464 type:complete len:105 (+) Transcript_3625:381-695(+)